MDPDTTSELPKIQIAAGLVVGGGGKLLLMRKRGTQPFIQPGGRVQPGERPIDALRREMKDELGVIISASSPMPLGHFSAPAANDPSYVTEADVFKLALIQSPTPAGEIEEVIWVAPEQASLLNLCALTRDHLLPLFRGMSSGKLAPILS